MKIGEVRERIGSMKEEELRRLICEIYKAIPKNVKEEKNIDSFFDLQSNEKEKLPKETKVSNKPQVDMDVLEKFHPIAFVDSFSKIIGIIKADT